MRTSLIACFLLSGIAFGARVKDLASVRGARDNPLIGYGMVVGLNGTGDKDLEITSSSLQLTLKGMGVDLRPKTTETKNVAAVIVSANLRPFTKIGTRLDITLSSVGTATSLAGGTLMMTALRGADGQVYAMAQGKITGAAPAGGGAAAAAAGVSEKIPGGAILEKEVTLDFKDMQEVRYLLNAPDFTTSARMARRINEELGARYATARDPGTVDVVFPIGYQGNLIELLAQIENVSVEADTKARVVIQQKTGTVILGEHVTIAPVAISHNNLRIEIQKAPPQGREIAANQKPQIAEGSLLMAPEATKVSDLVDSLNNLGATPTDLVAILQALKTSGALVAELEIQ